MVSAIAFCPSPPLLVPELAAGAAGELDPLRAACREAVGRLLAARPDEVVVIGTGSTGGRFPPGTTGTLAGYGVPLTAALPGAPPRPGPLPLPLTLGAWLLSGAGVPCRGVAVDGELSRGTPELPDAPAYLVVGDGSARRSERAPGYVDPRAEPFDAAALRDLDPVLGADLLAAGVPAWRAVGRALAGRRFEADLSYDAAPYGVGYFVAFWAAR
ncbi:MAG TPA: hypothetical protein VNC85_10330 [Mycobacteriales bacterium]|nr:hypothetical protein [Mycobacteriales bacterium]